MRRWASCRPQNHGRNRISGGIVREDFTDRNKSRSAVWHGERLFRWVLPRQNSHVFKAAAAAVMDSLFICGHKL